MSTRVMLGRKFNFGLLAKINRHAWSQHTEFDCISCLFRSSLHMYCLKMRLAYGVIVHSKLSVKRLWGYKDPYDNTQHIRPSA